VFDLSGRIVRTLANGARPAGEGTLTWNGTDDAGRRVAAGIYVVRLDAPGFHEERRIVRMR
jgi:flagellar basal-body rod modification protein FlgD